MNGCLFLGVGVHLCVGVCEECRGHPPTYTHKHTHGNQNTHSHRDTHTYKHTLPALHTNMHAHTHTQPHTQLHMDTPTHHANTSNAHTQNPCGWLCTGGHCTRRLLFGPATRTGKTCRKSWRLGTVLEVHSKGWKKTNQRCSRPERTGFRLTLKANKVISKPLTAPRIKGGKEFSGIPHRTNTSISIFTEGGVWGGI